MKRPLDIGSGQKTVTTAGTRERLVASATEREVLSVTIKALRSNTDDVYVGDHAVSSSTGLILAPGEAVTIEAKDSKNPILLSDIFLDVAVDGEGVSFIYVRE